MELVKICPSCSTENRPSDMMCGRCFGDISGVGPGERGGKGTVEKRGAMAFLRILAGKGEGITVRDGDIVGRSATGKEFLAPHWNVSRRHVQFRVVDGVWTLSDLGSANGTYIDGVRAPTGAPVTLAAGQVVRFSSTFEAVVEILPDE